MKSLALLASEIFPKKYFVTAEAETEADIDASIKRKRFRVSLKTVENAASDSFAVVLAYLDNGLN